MRRTSFLKNNRKYIALLSGILLVNLIIKMFFFDVFKVKGNSMYPTLRSDEYILISKVACGPRCPQNIFEIPWIGNIASWILPKKQIDNILKSSSQTFSSIGRYDIKRRYSYFQFALLHNKICNKTLHRATWGFYQFILEWEFYCSYNTI